MESSHTFGKRGNGDSGLEAEWHPTLLLANCPVSVDSAKQFVSAIRSLSQVFKFGGPYWISSESGSVIVIPDSFKWRKYLRHRMYRSQDSFGDGSPVPIPQYTSSKVSYHVFPSMCTSNAITNLLSVLLIWTCLVTGLLCSMDGKNFIGFGFLNRWFNIFCTLFSTIKS